LGWLGQALEAPLLPRLLAGGWVPPLPRANLQKALASFPASLAELLLPADAVLARCPDLPPLTASETRRLQSLWDAAAPAAARA
jgi:putative spermidine/putrescine transport system substrate-binding protein